MKEAKKTENEKTETNYDSEITEKTHSFMQSADRAHPSCHTADHMAFFRQTV